MKERPILFNGPMVIAILEGRKTQTRLVCKKQPESHRWAGLDLYAFRQKTYLCTDGLHWRFQHALGRDAEKPTWVKSPYGKPGDRLWVRETFGHNLCLNCQIHYKSDEPEWKDKSLNPNARWYPSIHMPRWASRITLEIVSVRVERLQDISETDAMAEGLKTLSKDGELYKWGIPDRDGLPGNDDLGWHWEEWESDPLAAFHKLWQSIHGRGSWEKNPWVWVIEFKRVNDARGE